MIDWYVDIRHLSPEDRVRLAQKIQELDTAAHIGWDPTIAANVRFLVRRASRYGGRACWNRRGLSVPDIRGCPLKEIKI